MKVKVKTVQREKPVIAAGAKMWFARYAPINLEPKNSIGAKWPRMLDAINLRPIVEGKRTAIKMHFGGGTGFTTIHPIFIRKLVEAVKAAGAKEVFATDLPWAVRSGAERGYTPETIGCPMVSATGTSDKYVYRVPVDPPIKDFKEVELAGEIVDADALIDLSHVKGHGAASFGGASKNLSMGCVSGRTRTALHSLEGGLEWDSKKCTRCKICQENCPNDAIKFTKDGNFECFYHNCKFCQHCVLICPKQGLKMAGGAYETFQQAMATTSSKVLDTFDPKHVLFINFLMNITIYCDCWGMTTPNLVPDIGILASQDIAAIEQATLDLIKHEDLIPGSLPEGLDPRDSGHLFERIHGKDPFILIEHLARLRNGKRTYAMKEVS
ncbi:MAG TPA: DUF362 domain-containing protein [Planctomycetota bacterium]